MSKLLLTVSLFLFCISGSVCSAEEPAQPPKAKPAGAAKSRVKGPVTVTSDSLLADNQAHTALFEKNVVAKTADMTMTADWMLVSYTDPGGEITKIDIRGNVRIHRDDKVMTAQEAVYYATAPERIIFTGNPRVVDGQNVVSGTKISYFVADDRSLVEGGSKVIMKNKQDR